MEVRLTARTFRDEVDRLASLDPAFTRLTATFGIPAFWHRPPGFASLVLLVLEQQVSLASARSAFQRLSGAVGGVEPEAIAAAGEEVLRAAGVTRQKAGYLVGLAGDVMEGILDLESLGSMDDHNARAHLLSRRGIGPWTADVYLLACLGRKDVWPVGDRALQVAVAEELGLPSPPSPDRLEVLGGAWRPHRSTAARLLWHAYLSRRSRPAEAPAGSSRHATRGSLRP